MNTGIYAIEGKIGEIYVGSAVSIPKRKREHYTALRKGKHPNRHLQAAFDKYGESYFTFKVLEIVKDTSKLLYYEQLWLDIAFTSADTVYNILTKAGNSLGFRFTDEQKQKVSKALTGKKKPPLSEEHKIAIGLAVRNAAIARHAAIKKKPKPFTKERLEAMSLGQKQAWQRRKTLQS